MTSKHRHQKSKRQLKKMLQKQPVNDNNEQGSQDTIEAIRHNIYKQLPEMFQNALEAYHAIIHASDEEDHKRLQARHNAAKTALTHIQQLVRLGDWAMLAEADGKQDVLKLAELITEARTEMNTQILTHHEELS